MTIGIEKNEIRSESKRFRKAFSMSVLLQELLFQPRQFKCHRPGGPTFGRHPPRRVARYPDYVVELLYRDGIHLFVVKLIVLLKAF